MDENEDIRCTAMGKYRGKAPARTLPQYPPPNKTE